MWIVCLLSALSCIASISSHPSSNLFPLNLIAHPGSRSVTSTRPHAYPTMTPASTLSSVVRFSPSLPPLLASFSSFAQSSHSHNLEHVSLTIGNICLPSPPLSRPCLLPSSPHNRLPHPPHFRLSGNDSCPPPTGPRLHRLFQPLVLHEGRRKLGGKR